MSQFTFEEWDKIIGEKEAVVLRIDELAKHADENLKKHTTPHYNMKSCPRCAGTKITGFILKDRCPDCDDNGQVKTGTAYYYTPGDPWGWCRWEKYTAPALARHELRQLLIKRFMDLNPDHILSRAIQSDLISGSSLLIKPNINYHSMDTDSQLTTLKSPILLLNGSSYGWETWGHSIQGREG